MSKILGIECAGDSLSVAFCDRGDTLSFRKVTLDTGYPEVILPMIQEIMGEAGVLYGDIDAVAASKGAGSFTGIRIALSVAKGISMIVGCRALGISNFLASAFMVPTEERDGASAIVSVLDTRRDDFYVQTFDTDLKPLGSPLAVEANEFVVPEGKILLVGNASERFYESLNDKTDLYVVPKSEPDALNIAELAEFYIKNADETFDLTPLYVTPANVTCKS